MDLVILKLSCSKLGILFVSSYKTMHYVRVMQQLLIILSSSINWPLDHCNVRKWQTFQMLCVNLHFEMGILWCLVVSFWTDDYSSINKWSLVNVYCIQAIENYVGVLKNVHFDHQLWVLCPEFWKRTSRFWNLCQSDCKKRYCNKTIHKYTARSTNAQHSPQMHDPQMHSTIHECTARFTNAQQDSRMRTAIHKCIPRSTNVSY